MSTTSRTGGGNKVVTNNRGTESRTYTPSGKCVDITHHEGNGKNHSHKVGPGLLGPFAGKRK